jgi:hypothetical protein
MILGVLAEGGEKLSSADKGLNGVSGISRLGTTNQCIVDSGQE